MLNSVSHIALSRILDFWRDESGASLVFTLNAPTGTSTFTVNVFPTSPLVGEVVHFAIEGDGGFTVSGTQQELADIGIKVSFGEAGATYESARAFGKTDATYEWGRDVACVYTSTGVKTWKVEGFMFGQAVREQTGTITVVDIDSLSPNKDWYVDFNGSTAGMPAEDGTVEHILSYSEWAAKSGTTSSGDVLRIRFRRGATHDLVASTGQEQWLNNAGTTYVETFGSGAKPIIRGTGTYNGTGGGGFQFIRMNGTNQRMVVRELEVDGQYNPVTGAYAGSRLFPFHCTVTGGKVSLWRCNMHGYVNMEHGLGSDTSVATYFGMVDCDISNWNDYGWYGAATSIRVVGCTIKQSPLVAHLAPADDGKISTNPSAPDHGPFRSYYGHRTGIVSCIGASNSGWSSLGSAGGSIQPVWRFAYDPSTSIFDRGDLRISIENTEAWGPNLFALGVPNGDLSNFAYRCWSIIQGNKLNVMVGGTGSRFASSLSIGGLILQNNVGFMPDAGSPVPYENATMASKDRQYALVVNAAYDAPDLIRCNTLVIDHDPQTAFQSVPGDVGIANYNADSAAPTATDNLLSVDNFTPAASYYASSAFSRGGGFRAITGGAADVTATGTKPAFDFEYTVRETGTKAGAYHATAANVAGTTPAYTGSGSTIALINGNVDFYGVTDFDDANWTGFDPYLAEYNWKLGGVANPDANTTFRSYWMPGATGNLTCTIIGANTGGRGGSAVSNTIAVS